MYSLWLDLGALFLQYLEKNSKSYKALWVMDEASMGAGDWSGGPL